DSGVCIVDRCRPVKTGAVTGRRRRPRPFALRLDRSAGQLRATRHVLERPRQPVEPGMDLIEFLVSVGGLGLHFVLAAPLLRPSCWAARALVAVIVAP